MLKGNKDLLRINKDEDELELLLKEDYLNTILDSIQVQDPVQSPDPPRGSPGIFFFLIMDQTKIMVNPFLSLWPHRLSPFLGVCYCRPYSSSYLPWH